MTLKVRRDAHRASRLVCQLGADARFHVVETRVEPSNGAQRVRVVIAGDEQPRGWVTARKTRLGNSLIRLQPDESRTERPSSAMAQSARMSRDRRAAPSSQSAEAFAWSPPVPDASASSVSSGRRPGRIRSREAATDAALPINDCPSPAACEWIDSIGRAGGGRPGAEFRHGKQACKPAGTDETAVAGPDGAISMHAAAAEHAPGSQAASRWQSTAHAISGHSTRAGDVTHSTRRGPSNSASSDSLVPSAELEVSAYDLSERAATEESKIEAKRSLAASVGAALKAKRVAFKDEATFLAALVREWDPNRDGNVSKMGEGRRRYGWPQHGCSPAQGTRGSRPRAARGLARLAASRGPRPRPHSKHLPPSVLLSPDMRCSCIAVPASLSQQAASGDAAPLAHRSFTSPHQSTPVSRLHRVPSERAKPREPGGRQGGGRPLRSPRQGQARGA